MLRALHYSHALLDQLIQKFPNGHYIDATLGNGHDLMYILNHSHFQGHVYGFDIQPLAIQNTSHKIATLDDSRRHNATIFQSSHDRIDQLIESTVSFSGAIFNLGYLPGGDHNITTTYASTMSAIQQIAARIVKHGQIILVVYSGHPQGQEEKTVLFERLSKWNQDEFQVLHYGFINQINHPPFLLIIEKLK